MKLSSEKTGKSCQGKGFVLFPLAFFLTGCLFIYVFLYPSIEPYIALASHVFGTEAPNFDVSGSDKFTLPEVSDNDGTVPLSEITYPKEGDLYARLSVPSAEIECDLYYGDSKKLLKKGAGTYAGAFIPGYDRTTLIAGHNHTYFSTLWKAEVGDSVFIDTFYGSYEYRITGTNIADYDDETAYDLLKKEENIILYTCYPFKLLGYYQKRYFVYGEYVSGPMIDKTR